MELTVTNLWESWQNQFRTGGLLTTRIQEGFSYDLNFYKVSLRYSHDSDNPLQQHYGSTTVQRDIFLENQAKDMNDK